MPKIISRKEAKEAGLKFYFTGKACKHGHVAERYASRGQCIICNSEKGREWKAANAEHVSEYNREWNAANSEYRAERYAANVEYIREQQRKRYVANAEYLREYNRQWTAANPEKRAAIKRNRRARVLNAEGRHTAADIDNLYKKQKGQCAKCKKLLVVTTYHVDHIMPLSKGGSNWPSNLQLLCPTCNLRKGAKHPAEFMEVRV